MPYAPTAEQKAILAHDRHRHARVLAGPGTGKSATLVALVDQLLEGNPAPSIKLLTFTRAATAELAKKVSEHPAAAAERPSTVHSFSISVLLRNPGAGGFPAPLRIADDWEDKQIVLPTLSHRAGVQVRKLSRLIHEMAANWESLQPASDPRVDAADRARFLAAWSEHRQVYGYTLLAELPYQLRQALHDHPDLEGVNYDLLIVDEYQDLNACDLEVLHLIAERGCAIIGAGDDDQSIYSFRRAAPEGIRRFAGDYPGCADYPLSVTQRCGARIIEWASYVINGDLGRPPGRPPLRAADGSPPGEVALLAFDREGSEARGVALLVQHLKGLAVPYDQILVLLRGDYNEAFSKPIKDELDALQIPYSDPEAVVRMLAEAQNRQMLAMFRLLVNQRDSLAWATLLLLSPGVGESFCDFVYELARVGRIQFGDALFNSFEANFPGAPRSAARVTALMRSVSEWIASTQLAAETPEEGWGHWMVAAAAGGIIPVPSPEFATLLEALDSLVEGADFGRYLSQIAPLAKDRALAESQGVRIMTMGGAKGLTVRATIVVGVEEGVVPRPDTDLGEERRLAYVAMTRAREFLYCTWARRRIGPTAHAGAPRVQDRRTYSSFLRGGPVNSQDGLTYLGLRN
jgi:DNA helicase II / ATP-dependent DNA helicase PcrA